jgi:hypothetical protein
MVVIVNGVSSQNRNPLAYTSWEARTRDPYSNGIAGRTTIDFNEDTFAASYVYGTIYGKYTVSGNTVTFVYSILGFIFQETGTLSGGRLIIGRATFYRS